MGPFQGQLRDRRSERATLDGLVKAVRTGHSQVLVVRGEPGVGKTALLDYLVGQLQGCRLVRATGVQSEMELAFAGLHQLCVPMFDHLGRLPVPQRDALRTAFGMSAGPPPDRFLVGLAVLTLLSEVAEERPLVCLVDDEQWLDHASEKALGFAARRLGAEPVGLVFAARVPGEELAGLPQLAVEGLEEGEARALLDSVLTGPLDARVRDQIVAEARGNPLALLELPRGLTPEQLAGGFGLPGAQPGAEPLSGRIEDSFRRQIDALPAQTRRLLMLAAADPSGDTLLVRRAAGQLGIGVEVEAPAVEEGLIDFTGRVRFRHPLVRSAAYRSASLQERRELHGALAAATDPDADPDRRAWHRAQAAAGPDEEVAAALEHWAGRAQARGGLAAAAAFSERAALLTPDPGRRAQRLIAAARASQDAGELEAALRLLVVVEAERLDPRQAAEVERLRGLIASDQRREGDAARLLLSAARKLEPLDPALTRETYLESLVAASLAGDLGRPGGRREVAEAARAGPADPGPPRAVDVLLDALTLRLTQGYAAAAPALARALELLLTMDVSTAEGRRWLWLAGGRAGSVAIELWDAESWYALAARQVQVARDTGALVQLRFAITHLGLYHIVGGELSTAERLIEEDRLIAEATGPPNVAYAEMMLAAWQGREEEASELIDAVVQLATERGTGILVAFAACASAVLSNGLGRHDAARDAVAPIFEHDYLGYGHLVVPELAEAAARTGDVALIQATLDWLSERTRVTPTDWVLGIEARIRALLSALLGDGEAADRWYRKSIEHLGRTRIRAQLARSHLLYGEWLRRDRRRAEAREQLRTAHGMLESMGMQAFAERAQRELLATGETARRRTIPASPRSASPRGAGPRSAGPQGAGPQGASVTEALTAQEAQVARLARDGLSNPEIGARLFISPRTVQYHLRSVFTKLGIVSRAQLQHALPAGL
jgi:DNA-binding CsgD family transcriptional regulator